MRTFNDTTKAEYERAEEELKRAEKNYEALCCGFATDGDANLGSVQDQLITLSNQISAINSQIKQANIKIKNAAEETKKVEKQLATSSKDYESTQKDFEAKRQAYEKIRADVDRIGYDPALLEQLTEKRRGCRSSMNCCEEKCQEFYQRYPYTNFEYKINQPDFDRSRIKGLVCNLFRVKDAKFATALEKTAGGKLFNVVVDTDLTGKILLESGSLKRKVTIIPMNKIKANVISERVLKIAREIVGRDQVHSALALIDYDPVYRPVMEYVFGGKLICNTLQAAKQVAFNQQILTNAVTLEGDHFDPEGVLSGGARAESGNILVKLAELRGDRDELETLTKEMQAIDLGLGAQKEKMGQWSGLKRVLDEHLSRLNTVKANLENTSYHQTLERKAALSGEMENRRLEIEGLERELALAKSRHEELSARNKSGSKEDEKKNEERIIAEKKMFIEKHHKAITKFQKVRIMVVCRNNELSYSRIS